MAQAAWEKPISAPQTNPAAGSRRRSQRVQFMIGGVIILVAVIVLVLQGMGAGGRFFITVEELVTNPAYVGQSVRVSGAVVGETIHYDAENLIIEFSVAHVPQDVADAGEALHAAVNDPAAVRMAVRVENQVKPDLLQHEAQAIMTGTMGADGVFYVSELNLKCPSRFIEGSVPSLGQGGA